MMLNTLAMSRLVVLVVLISILLSVNAYVSSYTHKFPVRAFSRRMFHLNEKNNNILKETSLGVSISADPFSSSSRWGSKSSKLPTPPPSLNDDNNKENEKQWQIDLLYDSRCPICMMEVEFLKKRDIHNKIRFTDLQSSDYNPAEHGNVQFEEGMRKIRAVLPDQTVVMGVEVFRQTYEAIGLGWIFSITKLPVIGYLADRVYDIWAENRLRLTGREELAEELKQKAEALRNIEVDDCDSDACGIDYDEL